MGFSQKSTAARQWGALAILILAVAMLSIDSTVLHLAVPSLTEALNPTANQILWIGDAYAFALAGLLVTMGNVADRFGRKRTLVVGSAVFGLASVIAALAPTASTLIAARALLGIAGATIMPSTLSIIRAMYTDPVERSRAIAIWSAGATAGSVLGPLIGGFLLEHARWNSVFLINVPIVALIIAVGTWLLPESRNSASAPIDIFSAVLSVTAIVPIVYLVKHAVSAGWDASIPCAAVLGVLSGVVFLRRQRELTTPLLDLDLFRIPAFSGAVAANTLTVFAFMGLVYFFSQYLQLVRGYSPLVAGIAEMPAAIAAIFVVVMIGWFVRRFGIGASIAIGLAMTAAGLVGIVATEHLSTYAGMAASLALIGVGVGVAYTLATDAIVSAAPSKRAGAASAISETGYELGTALGIGVLGTVQTAFYRAHLFLPPTTPPEVRRYAYDSLGSASYHLRSGHEEVLEHARIAFTQAMEVTALIAALLVCAAAFTAWKLVPAQLNED